jgi:hypothetical protein
LADIVRASGAGDKPTTCPFGSSEPSRASIRGLALRMANRLVFSRGSRLSSCWRGYCSTCAASRPRWCDSRVPGVITEAGINRTQSASPCAVIAKSAGLQSRSCSSRSKATARSYAIAMFLPRSSEARDRRQERQLGAYRLEVRHRGHALGDLAPRGTNREDPTGETPPAALSAHRGSALCGRPLTVSGLFSSKGV